ncbi:MAG: 50S ribosomal protein L4 [Acidobacteriota bacterium]
MTLDIVNAQNEKVGTIELGDALGAGRVRSDLVWQAVVRENASDRRGTHATKTRGEVSGTGRKPWRQKGTGRARVGETRNPLWRKGGTVFGPQPRSYDLGLPRKVERAALREALRAKFQAGQVIVVDEFGDVQKTKAASELLGRLGAGGPALVIDVKPADSLSRAVRNLAHARCVASGRLTARDVAGAKRLVASKAAVERLQEVLGS